MFDRSDDLLHPLPDDDYRRYETNYFGFNIPEMRLNCEIYVWLHTSLRFATSGVFIWQGMKQSPLEAEYFDYRSALPFPRGDLDDFALDNGLRIKCLDPMRRYQIDYVDTARGTEVHFDFEGVVPPIVDHAVASDGDDPHQSMGASTGSDFNQPGKVNGHLILKGEKHTIDGYFTRDHSWGTRSEVFAGEVALTKPRCVFDEKNAFLVAGVEPPGATWSQDTRSERARLRVEDGYVLVEGDLRKLVDAFKTTERFGDSVAPRQLDLLLVDERGNHHEIIGQAQAMLPQCPWPNLQVYWGQMKWTFGGLTGWGDSLDAFGNEFLHRWATTRDQGAL